MLDQVNQVLITKHFNFKTPACSLSRNLKYLFNDMITIYCSSSKSNEHNLTFRATSLKINLSDSPSPANSKENSNQIFQISHTHHKKCHEHQIGTSAEHWTHCWPILDSTTSKWLKLVTRLINNMANRRGIDPQNYQRHRTFSAFLIAFFIFQNKNWSTRPESENQSLFSSVFLLFTAPLWSRATLMRRKPRIIQSILTHMRGDMMENYGFFWGK